MAWPEAQSLCRTRHTDLASVKNMTENQRVKSMVPAGQKVWIGIFRDPWYWLDGSNSSFTYWKEGQPNKKNKPELCVVADFSSSGKWEDWPCETLPLFTTMQVSFNSPHSWFKYYWIYSCWIDAALKENRRTRRSTSDDRFVIWNVSCYMTKILFLQQLQRKKW